MDGRGDRVEVRWRRVGAVAGYLLLGAVGTAIAALVLLPLTQAVQRGIYGALYLHLGPSGATQTAILAHFLAVGVVAIAAPTIIGSYHSDRLAHGRALAAVLATMAGIVVAFLLVSLAGLAAFLTAVAALVVIAIGVPLLLRVGYGVRSGGLVAFVGGTPVLVLLLLLAGFGLGWGWGYDMTAEAVSNGAGPPTADFDDVPAVRDDLFAPGNCETGADDRRVCHLSLRGYEHELQAARFMARHGVRCPYQNAPVEPPGSFVADHDGTDYRVTCEPHGD